MQLHFRMGHRGDFVIVKRIVSIFRVCKLILVLLSPETAMLLSHILKCQSRVFFNLLRPIINHSLDILSYSRVVPPFDEASIVGIEYGSFLRGHQLVHGFLDICEIFHRVFRESFEIIGISFVCPVGIFREIGKWRRRERSGGLLETNWRGAPIESWRNANMLFL